MINFKLSQRLCSIFIISVVCFLVLIPSVSAFDFDNWKFDKDKTFDGKQVIGNSLLEKYKPLEIKNAFGLGQILFEGYLSQHDNTCGIDCKSTMQIRLNQDGVLIDDVIFKTLQSGGSWIEQDVRSYQFIANGENYNLGEEVKKGVYKVELDAQKKPSRTVDWIITTQGQTLNSWATWGNISTGSQAEVILNSPVDGSSALTFTPTFNATANITGGSTLVNMSLYTNITGSWAISNTTLFELQFSDFEDGASYLIANGQYKDSTYFDASGTVATISAAGASATTPFVGTYSYRLHGGGTGDSLNPVFATSTLSKGYDITYIRYYYNGSKDNPAAVWTAQLRYLNSTGGVISTDTLTYTNNWTLIENTTIPAGTKNVTFSFQNTNAFYSSALFLDDVTIGVGGSSVTQTWNRTIDSSTLWNVQACDSDGDCGFATSNYTVLLDTSKPAIVINSGNGTQSYGSLSINHTVNTTITDSNLDTCWYGYNNTNTTFSCSTGVLSSFNFTINDKMYNLTIYANDSIGNKNSQFISWDYYVFENSQSYSSSVTEGTTTLFSSNLTLSSRLRLSSADLFYNGTSYNGEYTEYATNEFYVYKSFNVPQVETQTNITFYWNLTFEDDTSQSTTSNNQTINIVAIDNCSSYTILLFNFTSVDEDSQIKINASSENVSIKASITLSNPNNNEQIINFSQEYKTNPAAICFDESLTAESYRLDGVIEYSANDKFIEYYNFQNYTLNNATYNKSITLYNLNSSSGQEFKITYKDNNFNLVPGALIQIQRNYIDEGVFKTVEIPIIGSSGSTIAHLVRNDVIYNLLIIDEGRVVATFTSIVAACQNPTFTDCEININSFSTGVSPTDFSSDGELSSVLYYNKTTKIVSTTYAILSGIPALTELNVTLWDALGNNSVCSDKLTSAGGTLSCTVPDSFGNSSIIIKLTSDGDVKRTAIVRLDSDPEDIYGTNLVFLSLIIIVTIIGMSITDNPMFLGIMMIFGSIILITLNLVSSLGFIGNGATILWFIVAVIILLIKGSNRQ